MMLLLLSVIEINRIFTFWLCCSLFGSFVLSLLDVVKSPRKARDRAETRTCRALVLLIFEGFVIC